MKWLALLALLLACNPGPGHWRHEWGAFEPLPGADLVIDAAFDAAPCTMNPVLWRGVVFWQTFPFQDQWGRLLTGAALSPEMLEVGWREPVTTTALAHELAHAVRWRCGLDDILGFADEAGVEALAQQIVQLAKDRGAP